MFIRFSPAPIPEPTEQEIRENERSLTAAELLERAVARNLRLEDQQPVYKTCLACSHWRFNSTDPGDSRSQVCTREAPEVGADGLGRWPGTLPSDRCGRFEQCLPQDQERRRVLSLYLFKLQAEQQAQQAERSQPRKRRAAR